MSRWSRPYALHKMMGGKKYMRRRDLSLSGGKQLTWQRHEKKSRFIEKKSVKGVFFLVDDRRPMIVYSLWAANRPWTTARLLTGRRQQRALQVLVVISCLIIRWIDTFLCWSFLLAVCVSIFLSPTLATFQPYTTINADLSSRRQRTSHQADLCNSVVANWR